MSDSLYCSEMMNIIRPKPKGFLQFSNAAMDRFGLDRKQQERARSARVKFQAYQPQQQTIIPKADSRTFDKTLPRQQERPQTIFHHNHDFTLNKHQSKLTATRLKQQQSTYLTEAQHLNETLPSYFHNQATRFAAAHTHEKTMRDLQVSSADWMPTKSDSKKQFKSSKFPCYLS